MRYRFYLLMLCLLSLSAPSFSSRAAASDFQLVKGSSLRFVASYQGEDFSGRFQRFTPAITFDPADLAHSHFDVRIALASASTDNSERDEMLLGSEFFDSVRQPEARYTANKFRALGGERFVADGQLNLRGVSKPVALHFTWTAGKPAILTGEATLNRLDFNVGGGEWADTELLPNAVKVRTRLLLLPAAPAAKARTQP